MIKLLCLNMLRDSFVWLQDVHVSYAHWFSSIIVICIVREFVSQVYYIYYSVNNRIKREKNKNRKSLYHSQFMLPSFLISVSFFTEYNSRNDFQHNQKFINDPSKAQIFYFLLIFFLIFFKFYLVSRDGNKTGFSGTYPSPPHSYPNRMGLDKHTQV